MKPGVLKLFYIIIFLFICSIVNSQPIEGIEVEIQVLDKITAKVENIRIKVNESIKFQSLNIEVYSCYKKPPEEIPEDFMLLRVYDEMNPNENKLIYQGWMISSSPSTTPLEHPIYDLWLKNCNIEIDF